MAGPARPTPRVRRDVLAALALLVCVSALPQALAQVAASAVSPPLSGAALVARLREGGVTLYFRHTATDFSRNDERMVAGDCTTQRNLSDGGRDDARAIGAEIRRLRIPIGEVLASPYCRTMETATLMFGRAEPAPEARGGPSMADAERYAELRKRLATPPAPRTVRVIASHGNPFRAIAGPPYLAEGEAAVVAPAPGGTFAVISRIPKDEWRALGR
ncbi:MAG: histidine phosphatase family protein [Betaproteobacteria bacterium]